MLSGIWKITHCTLLFIRYYNRTEIAFFAVNVTACKDMVGYRWAKNMTSFPCGTKGAHSSKFCELTAQGSVKPPATRERKQLSSSFVSRESDRSRNWTAHGPAHNPGPIMVCFWVTSSQILNNYHDLYRRKKSANLKAYHTTSKGESSFIVTCCSFVIQTLLA